MNTNKTGLMALRTMNHEPQTARSFHHRMARLVRDAFAVRCERPGCDAAASYVCEYDHQRSGKPVSGRKLYCAEHAGNFALKHNIYMAALPDVLHTELETASRDDWRYEDGEMRTVNGLRQAENPSSVICHPSSGINSEEK